jgi:DNA-binding transcriptional ArsR family regulator
MPALSDNPAPRIQVAPSAPLELMWLMHFIEAGHEHTGVFAPIEPLRVRLGPNLTDVRSDGGRQYSAEVVVLAHRSGTLLDLDLDTFFERFDDAVSDPAPVPSMRSESRDEVILISERISRLRSDRAHRKRYVETLRELWAAVEPEWQRDGRAAVIAESTRWTRALSQGTAYRQLLETSCLWESRPELDPMADAAAARGSLVLTPCWFGGKIHILELDGSFYVGRGIRHSEPSDKDVAAAVSTSIKALSDPTRLALLLRLAREPVSVTELARQFSLSQPTVSAHVQILREQGLLEEKTVGRRAMLSASEEGLRKLFSVAEESLIQAFRG